MNTNPLTQPEDHISPSASQGGQPETEEYQLTEVVRGRMFCIVHGRMCYRMVTVIGESIWVCPDERHRKQTRTT